MTRVGQDPIARWKTQHRPVSWLVALLGLHLLVACGSTEGEAIDLGTQVFEDPPLDSGSPSEPTAQVSWLGTSAAGFLVWFAGGDGASIAEAPAPLRMPVRDLAYGPSSGRAVAAYGDATAPELGRAAALPVEPAAGATFGPAVDLGQVSLPARVVPLSGAVGVFEARPVPGWRLLPSPPQSQPQHFSTPVSLWRRSDGAAFEAGLLLHVASQARLRWVRVALHDGRLELASETPLLRQWPLAGGSPRLAPHPRGVVSAGVVGQVLHLVVADARGVELRHHAIDVGARRLAALVRLRPAPRSDEAYALLLGPPTRLVLVRLDGEPVTAGVALPGELHLPEVALQRSLVTAGDRLWVATSMGVYAVDASADRAALTIDGAFDGRRLRGPLAGPLYGP